MCAAANDDDVMSARASIATALQVAAQLYKKLVAGHQLLNGMNLFNSQSRRLVPLYANSSGGYQFRGMLHILELFPTVGGQAHGEFHECRLYSIQLLQLLSGKMTPDNLDSVRSRWSDLYLKKVQSRFYG